MAQQNIKIMSKECKNARNIVGGAMVILIVICTIMSMSSCGSSYSTCSAYASVEKINNHE